MKLKSFIEQVKLNCDISGQMEGEWNDWGYWGAFKNQE
jgi:hypothetical protein